MTESYKFKSKLTTAVGAICTIITTLGVDQLEAIFPGYGKFIPAIVAIATWYSSQSTENTRVERAEKIAVEEYQQENYTKNGGIPKDALEGIPATQEEYDEDAGDDGDI